MKIPLWFLDEDLMLKFVLWGLGGVIWLACLGMLLLFLCGIVEIFK